MAFIPVQNTAMVEMRCLQDSQKVENTLYFHRAGGWTSMNLFDLCQGMRTWWIDHISPHVSDEVALSSVYAANLTTATSNIWEVAGAAQGLNIGAPLPNSSSLTVTFRTGNRGRSYRGRNYIIGMTKTQTVANSVIPATRLAYVAAYEQLFGLAGTIDAEWVVVSRFTNGNPRPAGITTQVTGVVIVDPTVDAQRRRLPGRGT